MPRKNAFQALQFRKPSSSCSLFDFSSLRTRSSTPMTLANHTYSTQDDDDVLGPLDDILLDVDLDQRSASSATLLSRRVSSLSTTHFSDVSDASSSAPLSESSSSRFLYPLHEPGQRIAQRTQRLRARTAAVIMSIPATCENVIDEDQEEPSKPSDVPLATHTSRLRRIPGIRDLRRAFRDADDAPAHSTSTPLLEPSKASYELGFLVAPTPLLSSLTPRSSLRTLVDLENALPHTPGDVKMLYDSTLGSISVTSRLATKLHTTFSSSRTSQTLVTDTSQYIKYPIRNLSLTRTRRRTPSHLDTRLSRSPGERVWSCAKISQAEVKRAARRSTPRRVFSHPS